jgi:hypothetical protein
VKPKNPRKAKPYTLIAKDIYKTTKLKILMQEKVKN